ncbi:MAG: lamin tail domain-containing protein, partial [Ignavibacteriae bacterium]|nr:lamin tail domain-containing protein [Ignavibacteriota bacterium]
MKYFIAIFIMVSSLIYSQTSVMINEIMSSNSSTLQDEDNDYSDWIEIYNPTSTTVNLNGFSITDDPTNLQKWIFPDIDIAADEYLIVFASGKDRTGPELHTGFSIKSAGETLILSDAITQIVDQVDAIEIPGDISYGRDNSNPTQWLFYNEATPGAENNTQGYIGFSENPIFSIEGGFYS